MKIGVKMFSTNLKLIADARLRYDKNEFDYIELTAIKGSYDEKVLRQIKEIPCIIHCDNNKVDISDESLHADNTKALKEAIKFADFFDAPYIILHPGYRGTYKQINRSIKEVPDSRYCMENMPALTVNDRLECLGRTKEELSRINFKHFCLDLNHATKASIYLKKEPRKFIKELVEFKPVVFHVSDGRLSEFEEHLDIGDGEIDIRSYKMFVDRWVTLETPKKNLENLRDDVQNIKKLKEIWNI